MFNGILNGLTPPGGGQGLGAQGVSPMQMMQSGGMMGGSDPASAGPSGIQPAQIQANVPGLQAPPQGPPQGLLAGIDPAKVQALGGAMGGQMGQKPQAAQPPQLPTPQLQNIQAPQLAGAMDPSQYLRRRG
jgi:hypothetical protein